jgi:signal transduction histidine kinase
LISDPQPVKRSANSSTGIGELRRQAKARRTERRSKAGAAQPPADGHRLLHELPVHQVELETQNTRNRELKREIARRQKVEEALERSQQHQILLLEQSRRMQEQLRLLSHQMLQAQEEERKRISRELHDEIAQTLVGINVHLEALIREAAFNPKGLKRGIARTQRLVEKSVNLLHRFARELRPPMLDDLGLIPALHGYMKDLMGRTGVRAHLAAFTLRKIERLNSAKRTVLYRVAQAALTNVIQHAKATRVGVKIQKHGESLVMEIRDDGKSFDAERAFLTKRRKRLGLIGMRERVEMVGGSFSVESAPGKGTTVRAQIPFGTAARGKRKSRRGPRSK